MKKKIIIILVIVLLCVGGYFVYKNFNTKKVEDSNREIKTVCTYEKETDHDTETFTITLNSKGDAVYHIQELYNYTYKDKDTYNARKTGFNGKDSTMPFYTVTFVFDDTALTETDTVESDYTTTTEETFTNNDAHNMALNGMTITHSEGKYSLSSFKTAYGDKGYDCKEESK